MNIERTAQDEKQRLTALLFSCDIPEETVKMLEPIIDNTAWMKAKLDDTRETIKGTSVAIPYDNGGGQTGIRENPLFKGYESLFKSYMSGMSKILDYIPAEQKSAVETAEKPKTVLQLVRERHGA